ncbi:MAG TPA: Lrp/AsnC family transcriptional regulator [Bacillota bacterium]|nr:Lrp/AsnC family transcriptional regulator [Bacillota bacterium]
MTRKEQQILELLEDDSRITPEKIAVMLDMKQEEVEAKIAKWEEQKIIVKYNTIVNWEKLGYDSVTAMIEVKITPQRDAGYDTIAERIYRYPEVQAVMLMSGGYDLSVLIEGTSLRAVANFVSEKLATIDGVVSTGTHFVLKKYKMGGVILNGKSDDDQRLVITP